MKNSLAIPLFLSFCLFTATAHGAQGISIDGKVKYKDGFTQFDYVSDKAQKGGHLVMHDLGGFDKLNPYTLKGSAPSGIDTLVFETLAVSSLDEPFAAYGLIAEDIDVAPDKLSVTFTLRKNARFSNGSPLTAEDVKFSLETLKGEAASPNYQIYFQDIEKAVVLGPHKVRFLFRQKNRELHMIASQLPVFSKQFFTDHPFDAPSMTPPVGSGPYRIKKVDAGKTIIYERNPDYWAKDLNVRQGMYNFDSVTYKVFKDQVVSLEAFKAGDFDFMQINVAKQWARDLDGEKFKQKELIKEYLPHKNNAGMQGFVFNIRKKIFKDPLVRKALGLAFDFEWTNSTLFFNQYTRCNSYFSNSTLAAQGLPKGIELSYLEPFRDQLPQEVFTKPLAPFTTIPPRSLRSNLREAKKLLKQAGWQLKDGTLTNASGEKFVFEFLIYSPFFDRVIEPYLKNLSRLGIKASIRKVDPALYVRRLQNFEFDMSVQVYGQSQSPGNEQRNFWHSSAATRKGSRNLIGISDPVVDNLVDRIIYAQTQEQLTAACRALDRVLWYGYYVVPNWYVPKHRVAYRNIFKKPSTLPLYYSPTQALMTWWIQDKKR